jgi:hypothetical protein
MTKLSTNTHTNKIHKNLHRSVIKRNLMKMTLHSAVVQNIKNYTLPLKTTFFFYKGNYPSSSFYVGKSDIKFYCILHILYTELGKYPVCSQD